MVGALISVLIIWVVTGILVYMAVDRVQNPDKIEIVADDMLIVASCGVAFNIVLVNCDVI